MSPLFKKGNQSGEPYFFTKGQQPWNKGKHYRVIPQGQWSFKYELCQECETKEKHGRHRHYSNGLCKSCYFKELRKKDDPEKQRRRTLKRREKIKNDPELRRQILLHQAQWRKTSPAYKKQLEKKKKKMRYQNFIQVFFETHKPMRKYKKLLFINFEYQDREYRVPTPVTKISKKMDDLTLFKIELKRYLDKKFIHSLTLDNQEWKSI